MTNLPQLMSPGTYLDQLVSVLTNKAGKLFICDITKNITG